MLCALLSRTHVPRYERRLCRLCTVPHCMTRDPPSPILRPPAPTRDPPPEFPPPHLPSPLPPSPRLHHPATPSLTLLPRPPTCAAIGWAALHQWLPVLRSQYSSAATKQLVLRVRIAPCITYGMELQRPARNGAYMMAVLRSTSAATCAASDMVDGVAKTTSKDIRIGIPASALVCRGFRQPSHGRARTPARHTHARWVADIRNPSAPEHVGSPAVRSA